MTAVTSLPQKLPVTRRPERLPRPRRGRRHRRGACCGWPCSGRQSYWIDELYSVNQSNGSLRQLLDVGFDRGPPTAVRAAPLGLDEDRREFRGLDPPAEHGHRPRCRRRHPRRAAAARSGAPRPLGDDDGHRRGERLGRLLARDPELLPAAPRRRRAHRHDPARRPARAARGGGSAARLVLVWFGWTLLAATAHPFGAVLSAGAVAVLAGRRRLVALRATGCGRRPSGRDRPSPAGSRSWLWIAHGAHQPEFAAGTTWIRAPGGQDVWDVVTTTFGSGGTEPAPGRLRVDVAARRTLRRSCSSPPPASTASTGAAARFARTSRTCPATRRTPCPATPCPATSPPPRGSSSR